MKPLDQVRRHQLRYEHEQTFNRRWLALFAKWALVWLVVVGTPVLVIGESSYAVGFTLFFAGIAMLVAVSTVRVRRQIGPTP